MRVVGTHFVVARAGEAVAVDVQRGQVEVTSNGQRSLVSAGSHWPSLPEVSPQAPAPVPSGAPPARDANMGHAAPVEPRATALPARGSASLSPRDQYEAASRLEAEQPAAAIALYRELAHQGGAWGENALFAAGRLEADRGDQDEARRLLHEYLVAVPGGPERERRSSAPQSLAVGSSMQPHGARTTAATTPAAPDDRRGAGHVRGRSSRGTRRGHRRRPARRRRARGRALALEPDGRAGARAPAPRSTWTPPRRARASSPPSSTPARSSGSRRRDRRTSKATLWVYDAQTLQLAVRPLTRRGALRRRGGRCGRALGQDGAARKPARQRPSRRPKQPPGAAHGTRPEVPPPGRRRPSPPLGPPLKPRGASRRWSAVRAPTGASAVVEPRAALGASVWPAAFGRHGGVGLGDPGRARRLRRDAGVSGRAARSLARGHRSAFERRAAGGSRSSSRAAPDSS